MNTISASASADRRQWFNVFHLVPGCESLAPKPEYMDKILAVKEERRQRDKASLEKFMADVGENGTAVHLTKQQLRVLSEKFKPNSMSRQEYRELLDTLCGFGVLKEEDKEYLSYREDIELADFSEPMGVLTTMPHGRRFFTQDFASSGGEVLDWARYMASFEDFNMETESFEKPRRSILFGKLRDALQQVRSFSEK